MFRQQIARQARLFSTTPIARKSPVDAIKDAAKTIDKTISGAAVKGIEKGGTFFFPSPLPPLPTSTLPMLLTLLTLPALAENMTTSYGPSLPPSFILL